MLYRLCEYLVSLVTKSSQAQRILLNLDLFDVLLSLFKDLEPVSYKVHDPRVLSRFQEHCQLNLKPEVLSELQNGSKDHEDLADKVATDLEIDQKYRHLVLDAVVQMCKFYSDLKTFDEKCLVEVSESVKDHRKTFERIWKTLEGRSGPKSLKLSRSDDRNSWAQLGFQMPLTDFRKTGHLGLLCLDFMSSNYPELSKKTLLLSRDEQNWFPFALTSINVTSWVLDFYNQNRLNAFSYNNPSSALDIFFVLHSYFFFMFTDFYLKNKPESVLQFNEVADKYKLELAGRLEKVVEDSYDEQRAEQAYGSSLLNKLKEELRAL